MHNALIGPIAEHEDAIEKKILTYAVSAKELAEFVKGIAEFHKDKCKYLDAKVFKKANQKVQQTVGSDELQDYCPQLKTVNGK